MTDQSRHLDRVRERVLSLREDLLAAGARERVPLDRIAGRTLAAPVEADRDVPDRSRATMDGYAVAAGDDPPHDLGDRIDLGDDPGEHVTGTARPIVTGASLPSGADAVVRIEDATVEGDRLHGPVPDRGRHVLARGSVVAAGETVLSRGRRLAPRDAVILRELGHDAVPVREPVPTAVLATGTEIHEGRAPDRDSEMLANLVRAWGGEPTLAGSAPDDPARVGDRIAALADEHAVVLTTGGTGVGPADETAGVLADRAEPVVGDATVRPGSNVTVARLSDAGTVVVALPGAPGAAFLGAALFVRPLLAGGGPMPDLDATVTRDLAVPDRDLTFVVPVEFVDGATESTDAPPDDGGETDRRVVPFGHPDSSVPLYGRRFRPHRVASCVDLSTADGFVLTDRDLAAGDSVAVVPFEVVET